MNKILSLIKTDLNTSFGLSALQYKLTNKRDRFQIILFGIVILSVLPSYMMIVKGLSNYMRLIIAWGRNPCFY